MSCASPSPADSGVSQVTVAISSGPGFTTWWNEGVSNWVAQSAPFWNTTNVAYSGADSGTWAWTHVGGVPSFQSSVRYLVLSSATDVAGNVQDSTATGVTGNVFGFDDVAPLAGVSLPADGSEVNALGTVSGTASDDYSGVSSLAVEIGYTQAGVTKYWTGTVNLPNDTFQTGATNLNGSYVGGSGPGFSSGTWSYVDAGLTPPALVSGTTYFIQVAGTDNAGNAAAFSSATFLFDSQASSPVITAPSYFYYGPSNALASISGTAQAQPLGNPLAQLSQVQVRLEDTNNITYWTGSSWTATANTWDTAVGTASWSVSGSSVPAWQNATQYEINARDIDQADNTSSYSTATFVWDSSGPPVQLQAPDQAYEPAPLSILSGTAFDSGSGVYFSGLSAIGVSIKNIGLGEYWNGTTFSGNLSEIFLPVSSAFTQGTRNSQGAQSVNWSLTGSTPTWVSGTSYRVNVQAQDAAGNPNVNLSSFTFIYDANIPQVGVTLPNSGRWNTLSLIQGTAGEGA
ncbi:MAG: hypothetical protein ACREKE_08895, partial [bacterium]